MTVELSSWREASADPGLIDSELHLWRFSLDSRSLPLEKLKTSVLNSTERKRAERFVDAEKSAQFILARCYLRIILGRYLNLSPEMVELAYHQYGKPFIAYGSANPLEFNLSHAHDRGVLAVTKGQAVGIDLERIDPKLEFLPIASRFFFPEEKALLRNYPEYKRRRAFYRLWTRKEAVLKCLGYGFSEKPEKQAQATAGIGTIRSFHYADGFLCSYAVQDHIKRILKFDAPDLTRMLN